MLLNKETKLICHCSGQVLETSASPTIWGIRGFFFQCAILSISEVGDCSHGRPKGSFSIATTSRCRGARYSFPWIAPIYPLYIPYNAECYAKKYRVPFFFFSSFNLGLNPSLPDHWQTLFPLGQCAIYWYHYQILDISFHHVNRI